MKKREITATDFGVILAVAISLSALIYLCWQYILLPVPKNEFCWYEIKYIHVSGQELTKKAYCDCDGFHHWHEGSKYKIEMEIPFVNGESVKIQGATDILSVQKVKE
jgi:hypothetical protein